MTPLLATCSVFGCRWCAQNVHDGDGGGARDGDVRDADALMPPAHNSDLWPRRPLGIHCGLWISPVPRCFHQTMLVATTAVGAGGLHDLYATPLFDPKFWKTKK